MRNKNNEKKFIFEITKKRLAATNIFQHQIKKITRNNNNEIYSMFEITKKGCSVPILSSAKQL